MDVVRVITGRKNLGMMFCGIKNLKIRMRFLRSCLLTNAEYTDHRFSTQFNLNTRTPKCSVKLTNVLNSFFKHSRGLRAAYKKISLKLYNFNSEKTVSSVIFVFNIEDFGFPLSQYCQFFYTSRQQLFMINTEQNTFCLKCFTVKSNSE